MSLFITVAVSIEGPDGTKHVNVARQDTSINAELGSSASEISMAQVMLDHLGREALQATASRLNELGAILGGLE